VCAIFAYIAVGLSRLQVEIRGDEFRFRGFWGQTTSGRVHEFIGMESTLFFEARLLRRNDLRTVNVSWLDLKPDYEKREDASHLAVMRWLTRFPHAHFHRAAELRKSKLMTEAEAVSALSERLKENEVYGRRGYEVSLAAISAWRSNARHLLPLLEKQLLQMPKTGPAFQYVLEALRALGNEATAARLAKMVELRNYEAPSLLISALGALATAEQRGVLVRVEARSEVPNCREVAHDALARLANLDADAV
jgi:hypothetical protein